MSTEALSSAEQSELERCVAIIRQGLSTWYEVGHALRTIRDKALYRATHRRFVQFCREEFSISKSWAYERMDASVVYDVVIRKSRCNLSEICPLERNNSTQFTTKALSAVAHGPPEKWVELVEQVASYPGKPTVKVVKAIVDAERKAARPPAPPRPDQVGDGLTPTVREALESADSFRGIQRELTGLVKRCERIAEQPFGVFLQKHLVEFKAAMRSAWEVLKFSTPYADCTACGQRGCKHCLSSGFLPRDLFNALPAELRARSRVVEFES